MTKKPKQFTNYLLGTLAGVFILRTVKLAYQRSRLERIIGRVVGGGPEKITISQAFVDKLPKTGLDFRGRSTEPLNFILLGDQAQIQRAFAATSWYKAVPINGSNWAKAFLAGLRDTSYPDGPMTPYYIYTTPQDLSFQQETTRKSFRQRHHVRFWRTNFELSDGTKLWLGMASYDKSLRLVNGFRFPYHHIDPDLDTERELIVKDLLSQGGKDAGRYTLGKTKGRNDHRDRYFTDGKIVVVDLRGVHLEA